MTKEIVVHTWCDVCTKNNLATAATTTPPIVIGNAKPRTLDLCDEHRTLVFAPLADLLREDGAVVDGATVKPPPKAVARAAAAPRAVAVDGITGPGEAGGWPADTPGPFLCAIPGCTGTQNRTGRGYPNIGALRSHIRYSHAEVVLWRDYLATYGEPEVLTNPAPPAVRQPRPSESSPDAPDYRCGIDGCDVSYPPERYNRPSQALGVHRKMAHGVVGQAKHPNRANADDETLPGVVAS